jgi:hypothetical protein
MVRILPPADSNGAVAEERAIAQKRRSNCVSVYLAPGYRQFRKHGRPGYGRGFAIKGQQVGLTVTPGEPSVRPGRNVRM